ncbi:flagellar hook-basal body complex protein FliE [Methylobacterium gregans]|uniref:flagellar hook-basal body complex protein FliE n=1 Tax=Methylobacterium gregans TaxID=374424 RepID=UPI003614DBB8
MALGLRQGRPGRRALARRHRAGAEERLRGRRSARGGVPAASPGGSTDFADIMAQLATSVRNDVRAGEAASIAGIQGKATTQQVVEAVMSAEQSLQTAVAIRDKVVAAYLELSRMAI